MTNLNIAIVGCGRWGKHYVRLFTELPGAHVTAICDEHSERLQTIGEKFPDSQLVTDLAQVLEMDDIDAVVVATPATSHYEITRRCLEAGKHVLVEKPITTVVAEAADLLALAEAKSVTLMVGHIFLYNSGIQKVRDYIKKGEVGDIYYIYSRRTNLGPIRQDVNALWDLASHDVYIFNHLLGKPPEWVSAVGAKVLKNSKEDVGFIALGYPGGVVGHIHVSWVDPSKVRELVVVGSDKRIVFDDLNSQELIRVFEKGVSARPETASYSGYQFVVHDGDIISPKIQASEPLKSQCQHFMASIASGKPPLSGGRAGLDVVRVMEAIDKSTERNGIPVEVAGGDEK